MTQNYIGTFNVESVKLDLKQKRVDMWATHEEGLRWPSPECGAMMPLYDHAPERAWRHLSADDACRSRAGSHADGSACPYRGPRGLRSIRASLRRLSMTNEALLKS